MAERVNPKNIDWEMMLADLDWESEMKERGVQLSYKPLAEPDVPRNFDYDAETGESSMTLDDVRVIVRLCRRTELAVYEFRVVAAKDGSEIAETVGGYPCAQDAANAAFSLLSRVEWHGGAPHLQFAIDERRERESRGE